MKENIIGWQQFVFRSTAPRLLLGENQYGLTGRRAAVDYKGHFPYRAFELRMETRDEAFPISHCCHGREEEEEEEFTAPEMEALLPASDGGVAL